MELNRINNNGLFGANYKHISNLGVIKKQFKNEKQLNDFINSYNIILDSRIPDDSSNIYKRKSKKKRTKKRSHRKSDGKRRSICKDYLGKKIGININEGIYKSRAQAIAVAYSQVGKKYPQCKRVLGIRSKRKSKKKSRIN
jgi:hypothetical protein